ncbi:TetR/AcrR family transcriptional regulator [Enterococcus lemanii]|jgi:AcrR family transcriptional regulator|uniref:TetR/AcrR family transcriptional regulator n=1 Tax=Enterococcus lemanii TaxID=1159752 RepID=A0ABV9MTQ5_9ENTE|nr:TetR/AcrR family transcriptional regulator [Enterococcus lemanii]MBM7709572.1 AcrR family transcriptional regulator [Enterococcus lemanii]NLM65758.1 TetR/AcrR family transcriptional regulator [Enterococcus sp.]
MEILTNEERKALKRQLILDGARRVFRQKGFIDVTMKDIIEECQISRGGIYLYFDSVDSIFIEVLKQRTSSKFDGIRLAVQANEPFEQLLDKYFAEHKDRLLNHVGHSMLRATYEYYYTHKTEEDHAFQQSQLQSTKQTIYEILKLGVKQGVIVDDDLDKIAENYMFVIEGLGVLAITGAVTKEQINNQIKIMKSLLPKKVNK